jgi:AraC-like DNA-binding protein
MTSTDLFHEILFRLADDLLRYTSMPVSEVARRCGANTQQNLCLLFRKRYNCTPTERRRSLQRKGEADMYCV